MAMTKEERQQMALALTAMTPEQRTEYYDECSLYDAAHDHMYQTFRHRNAIYRSAYDAAGVLGAVCALIGDTNRLINMVVKSPDHGRAHEREVRDKLIDVGNFATIALMLLERSNFDGPEGDSPLGDIDAPPGLSWSSVSGSRLDV